VGKLPIARRVPQARHSEVVPSPGDSVLILVYPALKGGAIFFRA
jgi:hypothetical protein